MTDLSDQDSLEKKSLAQLRVTHEDWGAEKLSPPQLQFYCPCAASDLLNPVPRLSSSLNLVTEQATFYFLLGYSDESNKRHLTNARAGVK